MLNGIFLVRRVDFGWDGIIFHTLWKNDGRYEADGKCCWLVDPSLSFPNNICHDGRKIVTSGSNLSEEPRCF